MAVATIVLSYKRHGIRVCLPVIKKRNGTSVTDQSDEENSEAQSCESHPESGRRWILRLGGGIKLFWLLGALWHRVLGVARVAFALARRISGARDGSHIVGSLHLQRYAIRMKDSEEVGLSHKGDACLVFGMDSLASLEYVIRQQAMKRSAAARKLLEADQ